MERVILDPVPVHLEAAALVEAIFAKSRGRVPETLADDATEAVAIARPKAVYRMVSVDAREPDGVVLEGVRFRSRILRVNLDRPQRAFAFVVTSGWELEGWSNAKPDLLSHYWADAINQAVVRQTNVALMEYLKSAFAIGEISMMNPGSLPDWPIAEQEPLFRLLGDTSSAIGVKLTPSFLMTPTKSVSGLFFPSQETFASCQLCPRLECPNRRAAYDAALFERRFQEIQTEAQR